MEDRDFITDVVKREKKGKTKIMPLSDEPDSVGPIKTGRDRSAPDTHANALKFWLMPFVCILLFGFPTEYGSIVSSLCGFAPACFFILFGYSTLKTDEEERRLRIKGRIMRSGILFLVLTLVYLSVNIGYLMMLGADAGALFKALLRKRVLFNFFVLNAWPFRMGGSIWFVQSLFYASVILLILHRTGLLKYKMKIMAVCFALTLVSGELAGMLDYNIFGYRYFTPNFLNYALPYLLLGGVMRELADKLSKVKSTVYLVMIPAGLAVAFAELYGLNRLGILSTTSFSVGFGITAFGLCAFSLFYPRSKTNLFSAIGLEFSRRIYVLCQPIALLIITIPVYYGSPFAGVVQMLGGIAVYPVTLAAAWIIDLLLITFRRH